MSNLLTETFEGVPGGMNLANPAQELDDTEARYLQDVLLDYPGLTRRRGPVTPLSAATFSDKMSDFFFTFDPAGTVRIGALSGDNTKGNFEAIQADLSAKNQIPWGQNLPANPPSPQNADQLPLWQRGEGVPIPFTEAQVSASSTRRLSLLPTPG